MEAETEVMRIIAKDPKTVGTTGSQKRKGVTPPESLGAEGREAAQTRLDLSLLGSVTTRD